MAMDYESLVQQMEQLSRDLKEATSALNDLSIQIKGIELVQHQQANVTGATSTQPKPVDMDQPQRTCGYVNWNTAHDILKTEKWKKMSVFTNFCGELERGMSPNFYSYIKMDDKNAVDEETRFPEDDLYVNVNNPLVRTEILYIKELRARKPVVGLVDRFLSVARDEVHTFSSFEKKYGLKWVSPLPESSDVVEAEPVQDVPVSSAPPVENLTVASAVSDSWSLDDTKIGIEEVESDSSTMNEVVSTDELIVKELSNKFADILDQLSHMNLELLLSKVMDLPINDQNRLEVITDLLFEKALEKPNSALLYATLAKKLSKLKVPSNSDLDSFVNFRGLIIQKCQVNFERFVKNKKEFAESNDIETEEELQTEIYKGTKITKNRAVANAKFIGELYKLKMLTEKIVLYCLEQLSGEVEEDKIECLCELLATAGQQLDSETPFFGRKFCVNSIFSDLQDMIDYKSDQISSSAQFMIQDIIDLRKRKWLKAMQHVCTAFPKTLDEIQEESEKRALLIELMNTFDVSASGGSGGDSVIVRRKKAVLGRDSDMKLYAVGFLKLNATSENTQNYIKLPPKSFQNLSLFGILEKLQADPATRAETLTADRDVAPTYHFAPGCLQAQIPFTDLQNIKAVKRTYVEQYEINADGDELVADMKELFPPQQLSISGTL